MAGPTPASSTPNPGPDLRTVFNSFAQKAVTDFPALQDKLLVYHFPMAEFFGPAGTESDKFAPADKRHFLKQIDAGAQKHFDTLDGPRPVFDPAVGSSAYASRASLKRAPDGRYHPPLDFQAIVMGPVDPLRRILSETSAPLESEVRNVLEHELGHQVVPGAYSGGQYGSQFRECAADTFALVRYAQDGGDLQKAATTASWMRTAKFMVMNREDHLTTPAVEGLKDLAKRHDFRNMSPAETANLAYRMASEYAPDPAQMQKAGKIFKPVSEAFQAGGMEAALKKTAEIMKQDHGAQNGLVFSLGRSFIAPVLEGKTDGLNVTVRGQRVSMDGLRLEGKIWDDMRKMIDGKSAWTAKRNAGPEGRLDQEARDAKLLGKFDRNSKTIISGDLRAYDLSQRIAEESYKEIRRQQTGMPAYKGQRLPREFTESMDPQLIARSIAVSEVAALGGTENIAALSPDQAAEAAGRIAEKPVTYKAKAYRGVPLDFEDDEKFIADQDPEKKTPDKGGEEPEKVSKTRTSVGAFNAKAGKTAGKTGILVDIASGDYGAATVSAAQQVILSPELVEEAAALAKNLKPVAVLLGQFAKRVPVIGAAVTTGYVGYEVLENALEGKFGKAGAAAAAGAAEIGGNLIGFGVGDSAREAVRGGIIAGAGEEYAVNKSGLRTLGERTLELGSRFVSGEPGTVAANTAPADPGQKGDPPARPPKPPEPV